MNALGLILLFSLTTARAEKTLALPPVAPGERNAPLVVLGDPKSNATTFIPRLARSAHLPFARLDFTHFDPNHPEKIWGPLSRNLAARPGPLLLAIEMPDPRTHREAFLYWSAQLTHREEFQYYGRTYSLRDVGYVLFVPDVGTLGPELDQISGIKKWKPDENCPMDLSPGAYVPNQNPGRGASPNP